MPVFAGVRNAVQHLVELVTGGAPVSSGNPLPVGLIAAVSDGNTTTTPLGAGVKFPGVWTQSLSHGIVSVGACSDQDSATDGLKIEWSSDGVNTCQDDVFSILGGAIGSGKTFTFSPPTEYFRVTYENGATPQTRFSLQTILRPGFKPSSHRMQDDIVAEDDAELVKAVLTAQKPDKTYANIDATTGGNLKVSIEEQNGTADLATETTQQDGSQKAQVTPTLGTPFVDPFGLPINTSPESLWNATMLADTNSYLWRDHSGDGVGGAAANTSRAWDSGKASALLKIGDGGSSPDGTFVLASGPYVPYIAGFGQGIDITGTFDSAAANVVQEAGYYSVDAVTGLPYTGILMRLDSTGLYLILINRGVVVSSVEQADWNGFATGATFDPTTRFIIHPDLQWLGNGAVRVIADMGSMVKGILHTFDNVQIGDSPYTESATLPVTYCIRADGGAVGTVAVMRQTCASVKTYGVHDIPGVTFPIDGGFAVGALAAIGTSLTPIMSVRSTDPFIPLFPRGIQLFAVDEPIYWQTRARATLTAPDWAAAIDPAGAPFDLDLAATAASGGRPIAHGIVAAGAKFSAGETGGIDFGGKEWLSMSPDGTFDWVTIMARVLNGAGTNVAAAPTFRAIM